MRIADPDGAWMAHPDDARLMMPGPARRHRRRGTPRYRLLDEGTIVDYDGFTIPTPRPPEGLDLNRNFPAGWGTGVRGTGDHPLSRAGDRRPRAGHRRPPEHLRLQRLPHQRRRAAAAVVDGRRLDAPARRRVGLEAAGRASAPRSPATRCTRSSRTSPGTSPITMSGAADDWAYEHLGVYAWTTEFWDAVHAATGEKQATDFWYLGPTDAQALAVLRWCDEQRTRSSTSPGTRSSTRSSGRSSSAAGTTSASGPTRRSTCCATRSRRTPVRRRPGDGGAVPRDRPHGGRRPRRRHVAGRGRHRQHRLAADAHVGARRQGPADEADRRRADRRARSSGAPARQLLGQLQGRTAARFGQWHDGTPGPRVGDVGRAGGAGTDGRR